MVTTASALLEIVEAEPGAEELLRHWAHRVMHRGEPSICYCTGHCTVGSALKGLRGLHFGLVIDGDRASRHQRPDGVFPESQFRMRPRSRDGTRPYLHASIWQAGGATAGLSGHAVPLLERLGWRPRIVLKCCASHGDSGLQGLINAGLYPYGGVLVYRLRDSGQPGWASEPEDVADYGLADEAAGARRIPEGAVVNERDGTVLVPIPAGEAIFGTPSGQGSPDESPQFRAALPAYYIALHPVTNAQWTRFVEATDYRRNDRNPEHASPRAVADHPVVYTNWFDAQAYCAWARLRLPYELEWEKAARGTDGRRYPWGEQWENGRQCVNSACSLKQPSTRSVWSRPSNRSPYGLYGMAGNTWEWCEDRYDESAYERYARGDLTPPQHGDGRVLRGGSWRTCSATHFRCSYRGFANPNSRRCVGGFRVASTVTPL